MYVFPRRCHLRASEYLGTSREQKMNLFPHSRTATLHHGLVLLRKALAEALAGLEELVDAAVDTRLLLRRYRLRREVVDAVVETSVLVRMDVHVDVTAARGICYGCEVRREGGTVRHTFARGSSTSA